ncbi:hypothetical protein TL16_g01605 [Triparma laevis f. inornata]|uniref:Uncharacterized protein n=1 Tax=Triparma laevis f. inornata TaxID=1714386 RepID=A0A9W6ZKX3_9STRA|nr:hypothetical protein TL16_g01605 [Triparma laevis f. inornata]
MPAAKINDRGKIVRPRARSARQILKSILTLLLPFLFYTLFIHLTSLTLPPPPPFYMTSSFPYPQSYPSTLTILKIFSRHSTPTSLHYSFSVPGVWTGKWMKVASQFDHYDPTYVAITPKREELSTPDIFTAMAHHSSYVAKVDTAMFNYIFPILFPRFRTKGSFDRDETLGENSCAAASIARRDETTRLN